MINYNPHFETPYNQTESLVEKAAHSKDSVIKDLVHGFLSGVDREGANKKYLSKQEVIENKIRKKYPGCDATLVYLQQRYYREYGR